MDEGSRAGLHFSCCGHVSERLVKLLSGRPGDTTTMDDSGIAPIARIDTFGIKNMQLDCSEFEKFAELTGIPQLQDCFSEFRVLTTIMLDKDLPSLLQPENAALRRRRYPILSLEKVGNILEKYVGTGLVRLYICQARVCVLHMSGRLVVLFGCLVAWLLEDVSVLSVFLALSHISLYLFYSSGRQALGCGRT
jgi:hypothetical protein